MSWDTDSFALKTRRTLRQVGENLTRLPEFWGEVQPPASLKGLDIPSRRAVFVHWKPSRRPASRMGKPTFR
jgi:hypothetical protein